MSREPQVDCATVEELAAAYALGALDVDEQRAVAEHLASCDRPHSEVHAAIEAADLVPMSLEPVVPSAALRDRLMGTIAATPQEHDVAPAAHGATPTPVRGAMPAVEPPGTPWWRTFRLPAAIAAVALAAVVGLGALAVQLRGDLDDRDAVLRAIASADAIHLATGAAGDGWVVSSGGEAMFMSDDLAPLPGGHLYEMWLIGPDGVPVGVGTLQDTSGVAIVTLDEPLADATTFAVTVETARVDAPTGDAVIVAPLDT